MTETAMEQTGDHPWEEPNMQAARPKESARAWQLTSRTKAAPLINQTQNNFLQFFFPAQTQIPN
jgi:hypothetical protein